MEHCSNRNREEGMREGKWSKMHGGEKRKRKREREREKQKIPFPGTGDANPGIDQRSWQGGYGCQHDDQKHYFVDEIKLQQL